ncbi:MAG: hypothetical protein HY444_02835 [Nitrospirae bacterium]|nr:hypothetical protein [Nitrospirota bacterium]
MHISVIGTGHVGLVTGACFVQIDLNVTCVGHVTPDRLVNTELTERIL